MGDYRVPPGRAEVVAVQGKKDPAPQPVDPEAKLLWMKLDFTMLKVTTKQNPVVSVGTWKGKTRRII